jgi:sporulation protein YlmC with PRC-barrel domain
MRVYATETAVEGEEFEGVQEGWEDIGEINDIVMDRDGQVQAVLVDIGGFLGIGERTVALSMDALRLVSDSATAEQADDFFLVVNANREALEGAPDYMATQSEGMNAEQAAAETDEAIAEGGETAEAEAGQAVEQTEMAAEQTMTETEAEVEQTEGQTEEMAAAEGGEEAMTEEGAAFAREGFVAAGAEDLTADRLQGAAVYDINDERIGEVGEILLSEDGQVRDLVIDVGGFLGIGEKPVALAMDSIDILRQDGGEEIRVYVSRTEEELEAMERYEAQ